MFCYWNVLSSLVSCAIFICGLVEFSLFTFTLFPFLWNGLWTHKDFDFSTFVFVELPSIEFCLRIHFPSYIQSILPGNVSHICRQDSGVTLFIEYPSWCLIWNSPAMDVIATGEGSVISQSVCLAASKRETQKWTVNILIFISKKRCTHMGLLQIRRMCVDYRHSVWVHWSWSKLEFWHLSLIFLRLFCVRWRAVSVGTSLLPGLANSIFDSELLKDS